MAEAAVQDGDRASGLTPRRRLGRRGGPGAPRLNITAMLDVMLQLLIFLLLTAGWTLEEGKLAAKLPERGAMAAADARQPLRIRVAAAGEVGYRLVVDGQGQQPADFRELAGMLRRLRRDGGQGGEGVAAGVRTVVVEADGHVRWQHVVNALNAAAKAGYEDVSFGEGG